MFPPKMEVLSVAFAVATTWSQKGTPYKVRLGFAEVINIKQIMQSTINSENVTEATIY